MMLDRPFERRDKCENNISAPPYRTKYRVAYGIKDDSVIPILLCGTHENFYEQLKKIR